MKSLFSFGGRISRGRFWAYFFVSCFLPSLTIIGTMLIFGAVSLAASLPSESTFTSIFIYLVIGVSMLAGFVALVATIVKRLHDRDESGWWSLVYFIPVVCLWVFIKCGFLKGTPGPNRFGPDPLAPPEQSYNSAPAAIVSTETVQTPVTP